MDKETFLSFYEKAGYKVIDSFTYNDIKLFLIRNRPKTVYRIIYIALLLLLLFCVGFLIGRLWHEASSAGLFFEQIGQCAIFTLLGCAAIIPIHEFVHWLAYKNEGAADVRFGAIWRSFAFYAAAHNFVADYYHFGALPLLLFSSYWDCCSYCCYFHCRCGHELPRLRYCCSISSLVPAI